MVPFMKNPFIKKCRIKQLLGCIIRSTFHTPRFCGIILCIILTLKKARLCHCWHNRAFVEISSIYCCFSCSANAARPQTVDYFVFDMPIVFEYLISDASRAFAPSVEYFSAEWGKCMYLPTSTDGVSAAISGVIVSTHLLTACAAVFPYASAYRKTPSPVPALV